MNKIAFFSWQKSCFRLKLDLSPNLSKQGFSADRQPIQSTTGLIDTAHSRNKTSDQTKMTTDNVERGNDEC
jgi:hypothetical protein